MTPLERSAGTRVPEKRLQDLATRELATTLDGVAGAFRKHARVALGRALSYGPLLLLQPANLILVVGDFFDDFLNEASSVVFGTIARNVINGLPTKFGKSRVITIRDAERSVMDQFAVTAYNVITFRLPWVYRFYTRIKFIADILEVLDSKSFRAVWKFLKFNRLYKLVELATILLLKVFSLVGWVLFTITFFENWDPEARTLRQDRPRKRCRKKGRFRTCE